MSRGGGGVGGAQILKSAENKARGTAYSNPC